MKRHRLSRRFRQTVRLGVSLGLVIGLSSIEAHSFVVGSFIVRSIAPPVAAAPLSEIRDRGYLSIAVKDNLPPLGFRDETGQLQGFEIDIARRLAEEILGDAEAVVLIPVSNRDRISSVLENEVDLAIAQVTQTPSRERLVSFSLPYYLDGTALVTRHPEIHQLSDLRDRSVALLNGSSAVPLLRYRLPTAQLLGVESYQDALQQLEAGNATAFAGDRSVLSGWVQDYPHYRLLSEVLSTEPLGVVMPKGLQYDELRQQVNAAIARWRAEGWLTERAAIWGL
ncbi:transporter substrate-binding domain-containing protein [Baaleninema sp.]|uniref:transporter substrate-binding domain-containing protein n=1 Tax=Baaleninema sp. TaxID=3101197 RepID=UPI003D042ED2